MERASIPSKSQTSSQSGLVQTVPSLEAGDMDVNPVGIAQATSFLFCALLQRIVAKTAVTPALSVL